MIKSPPCKKSPLCSPIIQSRKQANNSVVLQRSWDEHIDAVAFAYRINVQASTRKSPFELLYGVTATLPQQLKDDGGEYSWATDDATAEAISHGAETIVDVLQQKRKSAQENITAAQAKQKKRFDLKHAPPYLQC